ncbi:hypothetical protein ABG794_14270, partial [Enterobacter soli]
MFVFIQRCHCAIEIKDLPQLHGPAKIAEAFTEGRGDAHGGAARADLQGRFIRPSPMSLEQTLRVTAKRRFSC